MYRFSWSGVFPLIVLLVLSSCTKNDPSRFDSNDQPTYEKQVALQSVDNQLKAIEDLGLESLGADLQVDVTSGSQFIVDAGGQQFSDSNLLVLLQGKVSSLDGAAVEQVYWSQISGATAAVLQPNNLTTQVLLPDVVNVEELVFRLSAVNSNKYVNSDLADIMVMPLNGAFYAESVAGDEDGDNLQFNLHLKAPSTQQKILAYRTVDGTAKSGLDFVGVSGEAIFEAGDTDKTVLVTVLDDEYREGSEYFELLVTDPAQPQVAARRAIGLVRDNEGGPLSFSTPPVSEGPSDQTQDQLGDPQADVRFHLEWENAASQLKLHVFDPCENDIQALQIEALCQNAVGTYVAGEQSEAAIFTEDIVWMENVPAGVFRSMVEHVSGQATDYSLRVFWAGQSQLFTGTITGGDIVPITQIEITEPISKPTDPNSSSSSSSIESSSSSSIESSSSSSIESSSSSSIESSSSSVESSSSSSVESSSSSSVESSSSSSIESSSSSSIELSSSSSIESSSSSSIESSSSSVESSSSSSIESSSSSSIESSSSSSIELSSSSSIESSSSSSIESSSSSVSSSSSSGEILPVVIEFDSFEGVIVQPEIILEGRVLFDSLLTVTEFFLQLPANNSGQEEINILTAGELNSENGAFSVAVNLSDLGLESGSYEFVAVVTDSLNRVQQETISIEYLIPDEPQITLRTPVNDSEYFSEVLVEGRLIVASELTVASATLVIVDSSNFVASIDLEGAVDAQGNFSQTWLPPAETEYTLTVSVVDSLGRHSESAVIFRYQNVVVNLDLSHQYPTNDNGEIVLVGALQLDALVLSNTDILRNSFFIEMDRGDGWIQVARYPSDNVWDDSIESAHLAFDFRVLEAPFGLYPLRVRLDYDNGLFAYSEPIVVDYLADVLPQIALSEPAGGIYTGDVSVRGSITWATLPSEGVNSLSVFGRVIEVATGNILIQQLPFSIDGSEFFGSIDSELLAAGSYQLVVWAEVAGAYQSNEVTSSFSLRAILPLALELQTFENVVIRPEVVISGQVQFDPLFPVTELSLQLPPNGSGEEALNVFSVGAWDVQTGEFSVSLDFNALELSTGNQVFQVSAVDALSRSVLETVSVSYQIPDQPKIEILSPQNDTVYYSPLLIEGQTSIAAELTLDSLKLEIETSNLEIIALDVTAQVASDGSFSVSWVPPFTDQFRLLATVTDSFGRAASTSSLIRYQVPTLSVQLEHNLLLQEDSSFELLTPLSVNAYLFHEVEFPIDGFTLEQLVGNNWQPIKSFNVSDVYDFGAKQAALTLDFEKEGLAFGFYELRLRTDFAGNQTNYTSVPAFNYRATKPLLLTIDSPKTDEVYFEPVSVSGTLEWDTALGMTLFAQVKSSNSETIEEFALGLDEGNHFSLPITELGDYSVTIVAQNGEFSASASVDFSIKPIEVSLNVKHEHPVDTTDVIQLIGQLNLLAEVQSSTDIGFGYFSIERDNGEGWTEVAGFKPTSVWDENAQASVLGFDFRSIQVQFGLFPLRVALRYDTALANDLVVYSTPFEVQYIADTLPQITLEEPSGAYTPDQYVGVHGSVTWDPLLNVSEDVLVYGRVQEADTGIVVIERMPFGFDGDDFYGSISTDLLGIGSYQFVAWGEVAGTYRTQEVVSDFSYRSLLPLVAEFTAVTEALTQPDVLLSGRVQFDPSLAVTRLLLQLPPNGSGSDSIDLLQSGAWNIQDGSFSVPLNFTQLELEPGPHTFTVLALDQGERTSEDTITLVYQPVPIVFSDEITLPFEARATSAIGIALTSGVAQIDWNDGSPTTNISNQDVASISSAGYVSHEYPVGALGNSVTIRFSEGMETLKGLTGANDAYFFDVNLLSGASSLESLSFTSASGAINGAFVDLAKNNPKLATLSLGGQGSLGGDVAELPESLSFFNYTARSPNTFIGGSLANLPRKLTRFGVYGAATTLLDGDLTELPESLSFLNLSSSNDSSELTGNVLEIPQSLKTMYIAGSNRLSGNIEDLHANATTFAIYGKNAIAGDIGLLKAEGENLSISVQGENTISGKIENLPNRVVSLSVGGSNTISGDIGSVPNSLSFIVLGGSNSVNINSESLAWKPDRLNSLVLSGSGAGFSPTSVDTLLVHLNTVTSNVTGRSQISFLRTGDSPRTSKSDVAVSGLIGKGYSVTTAAKETP